MPGRCSSRKGWPDMESFVMVRYQVEPDRVAENEALVRAVYDELAETRPTWLRYATFALEDGVSFVHIAVFDPEGGELRDVAAFRRFREGLADRVVAPLSNTPMRKVGSYRVFGE
jgi:hypothetical protein